METQLDSITGCSNLSNALNSSAKALDARCLVHSIIRPRLMLCCHRIEAE